MRPEEIERIVQEVIHRLKSMGAATGRVNQQTDQASEVGILQLEDRLITLATLHGRLEGVSQLVVPKKAVVTPAVRDELTDRKIELVRQAQ